MADDKEKPAPAGNPLDKAADRLRDSAKWLLASFGAVAVVVFAGLTAADVGQLDGDTPDHRLAIAIAGATAAVVGVVAALVQAMRLAGASTTSLEDLTRGDGEPELVAARDEAKADPALATWDGDFAAFLDDYKAAYQQYVLRAEAFATSTARRPDPSPLRKARFQLDLMSTITTRILRTVSFLRLQRAFANARKAIAGWMVLTAAGAVAFGWATSDLPDPPPELEDRPVAGVLRPGKATVEELNRQLGDGCQVEVGDEVTVVVLASGQSDGEGEGDEGLAVVSVPDGDCGPARATVPATEVTTD
jgi:hypothetical protein